MSQDKAYERLIAIKEVDGKYGNTSIELRDKRSGKLLYTWQDNAQIDYPEDLCWSRMIGELFNEAFTLGYKYGRRSYEPRQGEQR
jgi:hypothetical protein